MEDSDDYYLAIKTSLAVEQVKLKVIDDKLNEHMAASEQRLRLVEESISRLTGRSIDWKFWTPIFITSIVALAGGCVTLVLQVSANLAELKVQTADLYLLIQKQERRLERWEDKD